MPAERSPRLFPLTALLTATALWACTEPPAAVKAIPEPAARSARAPGQERGSSPSAPNAASKPPTPGAEHAAAPPVYRAQRNMMGTIIEMTVLGMPGAQAAAGVEAAFAEMQRLEAVLSEWRPDSEISRINQQAGKSAVRVSEDTWKVIQAGLEVSRWSDGAFDLSWAALRGLYTFQQGEEHVPSAAEIDKRLPLIRYQDIIVDPGARTVMLRREGMKIGTGGIAKGYTLDRAADVLQKAGATSFMFFGGGQIQVHGPKGDRPWRVGIQHPRRDDYFGFVESTGGSISTSGDYEHAFVRDGKRWHHLLDPRTGLPVEHTMSVTVVANSGLYADALSTAIFVMGAERALSRIDTAPGGARAAIVDGDGRLHVSPGMESLLVLRAPLRPDGRLP